MALVWSATASAEFIPGTLVSADYRTESVFHVVAELRGVSIQASGTDSDGRRAIAGTVTDTEDNGRCAYVQFHAVDFGYVRQRACGAGTSASFWVPVTEEAIIFYAGSVGPDEPDSIADTIFEILPSTKREPELRGNWGIFWMLQSPKYAVFHLHRPGVDVIGSLEKVPDSAYPLPSNKWRLVSALRRTPMEAGAAGYCALYRSHMAITAGSGVNTESAAGMNCGASDEDEIRLEVHETVVGSDARVDLEACALSEGPYGAMRCTSARLPGRSRTAAVRPPRRRSAE